MLVEADQAEGLRRMMEQANTAHVIHLYSIGNTKAHLSSTPRIATCLQSTKNRVLVLQLAPSFDANVGANISQQRISLLEVAQKNNHYTQAIYHCAEGIDGLLLLQNEQLIHALSSNLKSSLEAIVMQLIQNYDVILVDVGTKVTLLMPMTLLQANKLIVQMAQDQATISTAATHIKPLNAFYHQPIGIIFTQGEEATASQQFAQLNQFVASDIHTELNFLGVMPSHTTFQNAETPKNSTIPAIPNSLLNNIQQFSMRQEAIAA